MSLMLVLVLVLPSEELDDSTIDMGVREPPREAALCLRMRLMTIALAALFALRTVRLRAIRISALFLAFFFASFRKFR
jgi:hypothetical protein